jgi:hypothetical protein
MPNWCENTVKVYGEQEELNKFCASFNVLKNETPLTVLIPYPTKFDGPFGYNNEGYNWCVANWGSKWHETDFFLKRFDFYVELNFVSAWEPPLVGYLSISNMFPELIFSCVYDEPGLCFMGASVFNAGSVLWKCVIDESKYPNWDNENDEDEWMSRVSGMFHRMSQEADHKVGSVLKLGKGFNELSGA